MFQSRFLMLANNGLHGVDIDGLSSWASQTAGSQQGGGNIMFEFKLFIVADDAYWDRDWGHLGSICCLWAEVNDL